MAKSSKVRAASAGKRLKVRLQYTFADDARRGAELDQPIFAVLQALYEGGSIVCAAQSVKRSYRHVWGLLRDWEELLGDALVIWSYGDRGHWSEFGICVW